MAALAPNSRSLIAGRAISGIGAAGISSGSLIVIASVVRKERQPSKLTLHFQGSIDSSAGYVGAVQGTFVLSELIGPVIGGAFTQRVTWRWCNQYITIWPQLV